MCVVQCVCGGQMTTNFWELVFTLHRMVDFQALVIRVVHGLDLPSHLSGLGPHPFDFLNLVPDHSQHSPCRYKVTLGTSFPLGQHLQNLVWMRLCVCVWGCPLAPTASYRPAEQPVWHSLPLSA